MIKISYKVKLEMYDGPLDLLCDLVSKSKIDIQEIYINEIITQYLIYIKNLSSYEIEQGADFLIMATKLLNIKSKNMLNIKVENEEDEEDLAKALAEQLEIYIKYKKAAQFFRGKCNLGNSSFFRVKEEVIDLDEEFIIEEFDKSYILEGILMILNEKPIESENKEETYNDKRLDKIIKEPFISVESKMEEITNILNETSEIDFEEISQTEKKGGKIASFLALLELNKRKSISTEQAYTFDNIIIKKIIEEKL